MSELHIDAGDQPTLVKIGPNGLGEAGMHIAAAFPSTAKLTTIVVTDDRVGGLHAEPLIASLRSAGLRVERFEIAAGEKSKTLAVAESLYTFLAERSVGRDAIIVALGGGVVSDLAGFVAATWMRGVGFVICPTTLESDVDACLGGKTAVNIPGGKNLVGAFHQPRLVLVDPNCLKTLSPRDVRAGLAECVKHALITSEDSLVWIEHNAGTLLALDEKVTTELILENLRIKGQIVERDVHEQSGVRELLNFGHTIGHAVESEVGYQLRHGECVGLGMIAACRLAKSLGILDQAIVDRVIALLSKLELPISLTKPIDIDSVLSAITLDKKARGGAVRFVLLEDVGRTVVRDDVPWEQVRAVCESLQ